MLRKHAKGDSQFRKLLEWRIRHAQAEATRQAQFRVDALAGIHVSFPSSAESSALPSAEATGAGL